MNRFPTRKANLPLVAAVLSVSPCAFAQEKEASLLVPAPLPPYQSLPQFPGIVLPRRNFAINLQNVPPSVMAFWLDPAHHLEPAAAKRFRQKAPIPLPPGIERLISFDLQKTLLVSGTEEGITQLRDLIAKLDRPQTQVLIQSELWHFEKASLPPFLEQLVKDSDGLKASLAVATEENTKSLRKLPGTKVLSAPQYLIGESLIYHWDNGVHVSPLSEAPTPNPDVWRFAPGYHSDMPKFKSRSDAPEYSIINGYRKIQPEPQEAFFSSIDIKIEFTLLGDGKAELSLSGPNIEGIRKTVIGDRQTLVIFVPRDESLEQGSNTFLLLTPRVAFNSNAASAMPLLP